MAQKTVLTFHFSYRSVDNDHFIRRCLFFLLFIMSGHTISLGAKQKDSNNKVLFSPIFQLFFLIPLQTTSSIDLPESFVGNKRNYNNNGGNDEYNDQRHEETKCWSVVAKPCCKNSKKAMSLSHTYHTTHIQHSLVSVVSVGIMGENRMSGCCERCNKASLIPFI